MSLTDPKFLASQQQQQDLPRTAIEYVDANNSMIVILVIAVCALVYSLWKASRDPKINFNLLHLFVGSDGVIVPERFIVTIAFLLHSWAIVKWILTGVVTTADFVSYGAIWVTPLIAAILRGKGNGHDKKNGS